MSRKAPTDAPKKCLFCEVRQGGGAYGKSASGAAFPGVSFFAHMFFPGLSPGSVDNRVSVFEKGESARRSRTTERSESVSEEAEERLNWHFLLTHLCGISHRTWRTFHTIRTDAEWLSQYTLRYRYVTGSGLRPDTPKVNGLTRPGIRSQTSCDRLRELHVSAVFTVIPEACEATAVKLIGVVVKRFTDVCLFIRVQFVELLQQR